MSHMSDSSAHILLASRHRYRRDAKGRPRGQPQASNSDKQHFPSMPRRPPSFAHVNSPRTGVNATPLAVAEEPSPLPRHPARHSGDHFHAAKNEGREAGRRRESSRAEFPSCRTLAPHVNLVPCQTEAAGLPARESSLSRVYSGSLNFDPSSTRNSISIPPRPVI